MQDAVFELQQVKSFEEFFNNVNIDIKSESIILLLKQ
jgi:hypothetical protein